MFGPPCSVEFSFFCPNRYEGPETMSLCVFYCIIEACKEPHRVRYLIQWHWLDIIDVSTRRYSIGFYIILKVESCIYFPNVP